MRGSIVALALFLGLEFFPQQFLLQVPSLAPSAGRCVHLDASQAVCVRAPVMLPCGGLPPAQRCGGWPEPGLWAVGCALSTCSADFGSRCG